MPGQLFTEYFLTEGIRHAPEWRDSVAKPQAFSAFASVAAERFQAFGRYHGANEAATKQELMPSAGAARLGSHSAAARCGGYRSINGIEEAAKIH